MRPEWSGTCCHDGTGRRAGAAPGGLDHLGATCSQLGSSGSSATPPAAPAAGSGKGQEAAAFSAHKLTCHIRSRSASHHQPRSRLQAALSPLQLGRYQYLGHGRSKPSAESDPAPAMIQLWRFGSVQSQPGGVDVSGNSSCSRSRIRSRSCAGAIHCSSWRLLLISLSKNCWTLLSIRHFGPWVWRRDAPWSRFMPHWSRV